MPSTDRKTAPGALRPGRFFRDGKSFAEPGIVIFPFGGYNGGDTTESILENFKKIFLFFRGKVWYDIPTNREKPGKEGNRDETV